MDFLASVIVFNAHQVSDPFSDELLLPVLSVEPGMPVGFFSVPVPPSALSSFYMPMPSRRSSPPSVVDCCCLLLGAMLCEVKGWGKVLVLLSILSLRQDMLLGLRGRTFPASLHPLPLPGS